MIICGIDSFDYPDLDEVKFKKIPTYFCVKNKTDLAIGGTFLSNFYQYLSVTLIPCINSTNSNITCRSNEDQTKFYDGNVLSLRAVGWNYDPTNFT